MITQITDNELALQATIERLERDIVAADIRIGNDALEIAGLTREQVGLALDAARWRALRDMECAMVPPDKLSYYIENYDKLDAHISNVSKASQAMGEAK